MSYYKDLRPIDRRIPAERQNAKRHYGVHPYFTRRPYNVVRDYISHYSRPGDVVIDPFGGSGVTAIEAMLIDRIGVQNDINPLANFIARSIADLRHGKSTEYGDALIELRSACEDRIHKLESMSESGVKRLLAQLELPENVELPRNSDVGHYRELFLPKQLAALAILRQHIGKLRNKAARQAMLVAWSATLTKLNRTFLSAEGRAESRGGSSVFSIYRFKVAKHPVVLPLWETFFERATNVIAAKIEVDTLLTVGPIERKDAFVIEGKDIDELATKYKGKADYIFTDPPYGGHISYLDLSTLWNCWLGTMPSRKAREHELIVGGDLKHSESLYVSRLHQSIKSCLQMLKADRWLSVVFQHWNVKYFEAILTAAAEGGADLKAAISQIGDPIWSMHKKKNDTVLAGEMILTFQKSGAIATMRASNSFDLEMVLDHILQKERGPIYSESVFNQLVITAWSKGAIGALAIDRTELSTLIAGRGWEYDQQQHWWAKTSVSSAQASLFA
ncbi:MAG: DNA methyltransferase [Betaproteobacteria bacterium]